MSISWPKYWSLSFSISLFHDWLLACCLVAKLCRTLCDCRPTDSSVHGIFQERILEWVAISYFIGSAWPNDTTYISGVSWIARKILYRCTTWEVQTEGQERSQNKNAKGIQSVLNLVKANIKHSLTPSQININPHNETPFISFAIMECMSSFQ